MHVRRTGAGDESLKFLRKLLDPCVVVLVGAHAGCAQLEQLAMQCVAALPQRLHLALLLAQLELEPTLLILECVQRVRKLRELLLDWPQLVVPDDYDLRT
jgi:hypothetical protein